MRAIIRAVHCESAWKECVTLDSQPTHCCHATTSPKAVSQSWPDGVPTFPIPIQFIRLFRVSSVAVAVLVAYSAAF